MAQASLSIDRPIVLPLVAQPAQKVTLALSVHTLPHLHLLPEGVGHIHAVVGERLISYVGWYERYRDVVELTVDLFELDSFYVDEFGRTVLDWAMPLSA